jgi:hypothetical protein
MTGMLVSGLPRLRLFWQGHLLWVIYERFRIGVDINTVSGKCMAGKATEGNPFLKEFK